VPERSALFTIGFTQKSAAAFFGLLQNAAVQRIVDTRLNNTGQLAGFAKRDDLAYFCRSLLAAEYVHWTESAPEDEMLAAYRNRQLSWTEYAEAYVALLERRKVEQQLKIVTDKRSCLLCSEAQPHHCHRSLLAEYLNRKSGGGFEVRHLV
jgi:uncharacterized protein (DUF488 family)